MQVFSLGSVKLVDNVPMLERTRDNARSWLKQWSTEANFMNIICKDQQEAIIAYRLEIKKLVEHHGYPAVNFEFDLMHHPVKIAEDGTNRFWEMAFRSSDLENIPVVPLFKEKSSKAKA